MGENAKGERKSAYAFYNQHDFCVYRRVVDSVLDGEAEFVRVAKIAVDYFIVNIRSRYYTEHFSELLSEDGGVVLCSYRGVVDAFCAYRESGVSPAPAYQDFFLSSVMQNGGAVITQFPML